ncbi:MAG: hypothetical protein NUW06_05090 [Candidatus Acetothermia bacterium]|nr:hypothetical protein [Candidatus Acetothermia bacterium]MDH7505523.1 hypothetical protein [Candidatus Acetothermia bacterium]
MCFRAALPSLCARLETFYEAALAELLLLKKKLELTDRLIDQVGYRLYGLTEEEIAILEGVCPG